jgi:CheY-like chemotaxis protein
MGGLSWLVLRPAAMDTSSFAGSKLYVAISVSDTGTGMAPEVASKAFEPFFSTKEIGKGTGLGLSQVLGFAQQSGGEVRIDSRLGRGTIVTLFLPRTRNALPKAATDEDPPRHHGQAASILVVDDDAAVRDFTVRALEELNYTALEADDGRVALDLLRDNDAVDLALIDLAMPGMNGRQLATRMRASDPQRKILFMTGYDDLSGTNDPLANEMVIKKPFKLVELAAAVELALGERGREPLPWNVTPIRPTKEKK